MSMCERQSFVCFVLPYCLCPNMSLEFSLTRLQKRSEVDDGTYLGS